MAQSQRRSPLPPDSRKIQKVPNLLLKERRQKENYIPKVVSIGPYHHGKPELRLAESVKPVTLERIFSGDNGRKDFYYQRIKHEISNVRNCYEQEYIHSYSDDELVQMMLHDACFIVIYIETSCICGQPKSDREIMIASNGGFMVQTLGRLSMSIVLHDLFLLENQIPLWIVKLLLESRYNKDEMEELLNRYMTRTLFGEFRPNRKLPPEIEQESLHLLEAFHRLIVFDFTDQPKKNCLNFSKCKFLCCCRAKETTVGGPNTDLESGASSQGKSRFRSRINDLKKKVCEKLSFKNRHEVDHAKGDLKKFVHSFRSVTDLKANGIHFKPSQTLSLKDVKFESNCIYAKLQLPVWFVSIYTKVFFLNMIAYELSPNNLNEGAVITYINLMKSLVVKLADVKELREKKILFCPLGSDGQILKLYQDVNTYGADNPSIFQDVKNKIQVHYNSRTKTWIAEFIYVHFRSPWSVITLLAATCILVLTILQTIYTMKSYFES